MADPHVNALAAIDRALAARPTQDAHALAAAVRSLAALRDGVVLRQRRDGGTRLLDSLERVNAILSVVMAVEFPIGEIPWKELEKARTWLVALAGPEAGQ